MNKRVIFDEPFHNLAATPLRTMLCLLLVFLSALAVLVLDRTDTEQRYEKWLQFEHAGRSTFVVSGRTQLLSIARCDSLSLQQGVLGAGSVVSTEQATSPTGGDTALTVVNATPYFATAMWGGLNSRGFGGVVVGRSVADKLRLEPGVNLALREGGAAHLVTIAAVASVPAKLDAYDGVLVRPVVPTGVTAQCFVSAVPSKRLAVADLLTGWFGTDVEVSSVLQGNALSEDPDAAYAQRLGILLIPALATGLLLFFSVIWFYRRRNFALYSILGVSRLGVFLMLSIEYAFVVLTPVAAAAVVVLWLRPASVLVVNTGWLLDLVTLLLLLLPAPAIGFLITSITSAASRIKGGN